MLYICDFFTRHKEAVSNQIELLAQHTDSPILGATRFMGQKPLRRSELKDRIFLFPDVAYKVILPLVIIFSGNKPIHYFEEEPSTWKRILFNRFNRPLYISMYRRPSAEYATHLKKYRNLRKIFVELDKHKDILVENGIKSEKIHVSYTPAKLEPRSPKKKFLSSKTAFAFASWNTSEGNALYDRGLLYLLDMLVINPGFTLNIVLRDSNTADFINEVKGRGIQDRVTLTEIKIPEDLTYVFEQCDFVAFPAQERVVKDVPNSLLDGLMFGKPSLLTDTIDFHEIVTKFGLGVVVPAHEQAKELKIEQKEYDAMRKRAQEYSKRHTKKSYLEIVDHYGEYR